MTDRCPCGNLLTKNPTADICSLNNCHDRIAGTEKVSDEYINAMGDLKSQNEILLRENEALRAEDSRLGTMITDSERPYEEQ